MQKYFDLVLDNNKDFIDIANKAIENTFLNYTHFNKECIKSLQKSDIRKNIYNIMVEKDYLTFNPNSYFVSIKDKLQNTFVFIINDKKCESRSSLYKIILSNSRLDNEVTLELNFLYNFFSMKFFSKSSLYNSFSFSEEEFTWGEEVSINKYTKEDNNCFASNQKNNTRIINENNYYINILKKILKMEIISEDMLEIIIFNYDIKTEKKDFYNLLLDINNLKKPDLFSFDIRKIKNKINLTKIENAI